MEIKTLYRYVRPDGGITVSPIMPNVDYELRYRIIAGEGMLVTNGTITTTCIDTMSKEGWTEIIDPYYEDKNLE